MRETRLRCQNCFELRKKQKGVPTRFGMRNEGRPVGELVEKKKTSLLGEGDSIWNCFPISKRKKRGDKALERDGKVLK